jgi:DNA-binding SARP family transcriptional activator
MAIWHAERAIAMEPYRESAYQHLMRAQAASGNRALVAKTYERCRSLLDDELGVSPSAETDAVYRQILQP